MWWVGKKKIYIIIIIPKPYNNKLHPQILCEYLIIIIKKKVEDKHLHHPKTDKVVTSFQQVDW